MSLSKQQKRDFNTALIAVNTLVDTLQMAIDTLKIRMGGIDLDKATKDMPYTCCFNMLLADITSPLQGSIRDALSLSRYISNVTKEDKNVTE